MEHEELIIFISYLLYKLQNKNYKRTAKLRSLCTLLCISNIIKYFEHVGNV